MGNALYKLARIPPTSLCPFSPTNPFSVAIAINFASNDELPVTNGMLVIERFFTLTGELNNDELSKKS